MTVSYTGWTTPAAGARPLVEVSQPTRSAEYKPSSSQCSEAIRVPQPPSLTMADHYAVTKHLRDFGNDELIGVGGALGLYYPHLRRMNPLLEEMVAAWLNREDNVLSASGDPSWASLIKALQDINQPGIAKKIAEGMELGVCVM